MKLHFSILKEGCYLGCVIGDKFEVLETSAIYPTVKIYLGDVVVGSFCCEITKVEEDLFNIEIPVF